MHRVYIWSMPSRVARLSDAQLLDIVTREQQLARIRPACSLACRPALAVPAKRLLVPSLAWNVAAACPSGHPRLSARHALVLDEVFASEGQQLAFGRMVNGFPADDLRGESASVLLDVVPEIGLRCMRSDHEDVGHAGQRFAELGEEFVFRPNGTAVLARVVIVTFDPLCLRMFGVEPEHFGVMMVDVDHCVQECHGMNPF
jgi:hypothetical protein